MAPEEDAEKVECLALVPVGRGPDVGHRIDHRRLPPVAVRAHAQALVQAHRQQVVDDGKAPGRRTRRFVAHRVHAPAEAGAARRMGFPFVLAVGQVVDPGQIDQRLEAQARGVAQAERHGAQVRCRHFDRQFTGQAGDPGRTRAQRFSHPAGKRLDEL